MVIIIPAIAWLVLLSIFHLVSIDNIIYTTGVSGTTSEMPLWILYIIVLIGYTGSLIIGLAIFYEKYY